MCLVLEDHKVTQGYFKFLYFTFFLCFKDDVIMVQLVAG